jgi:hypothetical protein
MESQDDANVARFRPARIPIARNLPGVIEVRYRIENRLFGQSRWERAKVGGLDFFKLEAPDRSKEGDGGDITTSTLIVCDGHSFLPD